MRVDGVDLAAVVVVNLEAGLLDLVIEDDELDDVL